MDEVRVRFAPSPTGKLHIGGARTAIYNWAYAKACKGKFILRIEDTDPARSTPENIDLILRALKWLELDWDEGPACDPQNNCLRDAQGKAQSEGNFGPYFQTHRYDSYNEALQKLIENDNAYPCFCTSEEIEANRQAALEAKVKFVDPCRAINKDEAMARVEAGESHVWRLKVPQDRGDIIVHDLVHGDSAFDASLQDDMILMRSDGNPTYNFCVVCDDANMKITHVIRGDDHLSNTPRQILIYEALGLDVPCFAHIPMICGEDGKKLSKRHGAQSVEEFRDMGYLSDALFNYLSLLGWAPDGETTIFSRNQMAKIFDLVNVSKNPSSLDFKKMDWINNQYIRSMNKDDYAIALLPHLVSQQTFASVEDAKTQFDTIKETYELVFERANTLVEAAQKIAFIFDAEMKLDEASAEKALKKEGNLAKTVLERSLEIFNACDWNFEDIDTKLKSLMEELGLKPRVFFQAIRVAVCLNMVSPPLVESIVLMDKDLVIKRMLNAISLAAD
ncbi:MAG: glutamate--tRNA ligase [Coriobacteriales bacterium]|nr:glutamate--tRNA ligase [Coriobacteriales bacterium]